MIIVFIILNSFTTSVTAKNEAVAGALNLSVVQAIALLRAQ
jgi:hypothetical protein